MNVGNVPVNVIGLDINNRLTDKGIKNQDDLIKKVRDTFTPTRDTFEKMTEELWSVCDCYTNYQITTNMPENVFSDSFGYAMQHDIADRMEDYYAGKMSDDELKQYFNDCCSDMRIYRAQQHQTSGNADDDNMQIVSQIREGSRQCEL